MSLAGRGLGRVVRLEGRLQVPPPLDPGAQLLPAGLEHGYDALPLPRKDIDVKKFSSTQSIIFGWPEGEADINLAQGLNGHGELVALASDAWELIPEEDRPARIAQD